MGSAGIAEAKKELLEVVSRRPRLVLARYWLGEIALQESLPAEAIRQLSAALSMLAESKDAPTSSAGEAKSTQAMHCHMYLGRALLMDGKLDQAIVEYQNALSHGPRRFRGSMNLVNLLAIRGRFAEAVAHCRKVLETDLKTGRAEQAGLDAGDLSGGVGPQRRQGGRNGPSSLVRGSGSREPMFSIRWPPPMPRHGQFPQAVATAEEALSLAKSAQRDHPGPRDSVAVGPVSCRSALSGCAARNIAAGRPPVVATLLCKAACRAGPSGSPPTCGTMSPQRTNLNQSVSQVRNL